MPPMSAVSLPILQTRNYFPWSNILLRSVLCVICQGYLVLQGTAIASFINKQTRFSVIYLYMCFFDILIKNNFASRTNTLEESEDL